MSFDNQAHPSAQRENNHTRSLVGLPALKITTPNSHFSQESRHSFFSDVPDETFSLIQRTEISEISELLDKIRLELQTINFKSNSKVAKGDSMNRIAKLIQELRYRLLAGIIHGDLVRKLIELRFDSSIYVLLSLLLFHATGDYSSLSSVTQIEDSPRAMTPNSFDRYFGERIEASNESSKLTDELEKMKKISYELKTSLSEIKDKAELPQSNIEPSRLLFLFDAVSNEMNELEAELTNYKRRESQLLEEHNKLFLKLEKERRMSAQTKSELSTMSSALGRVIRPS